MPLKQLKHRSLKFMPNAIKEETNGANNIVGVKSTGKLDPDSSHKITTGGSIRPYKISSGARMVTSGGSVLINSSVNPNMRKRNKNAMDKLVRIEF
jgi:hypothetical protein